MKNLFRLAKNIIALLLREIVNKGALLIMVFFIARLQGKAALGQYMLVLAISQILFFATDIGLNALLIREVARNKKDASRYLVNFGMVNLITGVLALVLVGLTSSLLKYPVELKHILYLSAISCFIVRFVVLFESVFQALEKMEYRFFTSLFKNIVFIGLGILHLTRGGGLLGLFSIFLLANVLALIFIAFVYSRQIGFRPAGPKVQFIRDYIVKTFPIWLTQLFAYTYLKGASVILHKMKGDEAVGIYNAGYVLVEGFLILGAVFAGAMFPLLSRLWANSKDQMRAAYEKALQFLVFVFLPAAVIAFMLGDRFILLLYGQGFSDTALIIRILSCTAFFVTFGVLNSYVIITLDKQKVMPYICGFGLILNLALNFSLIPRLSFIGAATSGLITEAVMFTIVMFLVRRFLKQISLGYSLIKTVAAVFLVGVFVYLFREINLFALVSLALVIYLLTVYALKGFIYKEREYVMKLLKIY